MKKLILPVLLVSAHFLVAQPDPELIGIRPVTKQVHRALQTSNPDDILNMRLQREDVMAFKKTLEGVSGQGLEVDKLLKEINQLAENWVEFDARQVKEFGQSWSEIQKFASDNAMDWTKSTYLFEVFEIEKKGLFHVEAKVVLKVLIPLANGFQQPMGVSFELVQVGEKWAMLGGILPDFEYGNDEWTEEAVEEVDDGGY